MDTLLRTILSNTYTKADLYHRYSMIREFAEDVSYRKREDRDVSLLDKLRNYFSQKGEDERHIAALVEWGEEVWSGLVTGNLNRQLHELSKSFRDLPIVVLYIPVELESSHIDEVGAVLRDKIGERVIFDTHTSDKVAGGCAFSYNGRFYNFSFTGRLSSHHDDIVEMIRHVNSGDISR